MYNSDSEGDNCEYDSLNKKAPKVYLITYSQADLEKFPTRLSFAKSVLCSFVETSATVVQWSCSREEHR